uniref:F-box domain containing protein n=1 Tax=Oryza sativa subsp. japonica TaxID=39947 RepID=Q8S7Q9_ORYSJ|nr:putative F-box domain containing protein [Oryza sativa Japonica Group]
MGTVLASAAALVATVCAEAAELAGTNRSGVTSAVKTGVESCSSAELLTLTATAATCLRGAAALKLRADVRGIGSNNNSVGTSTTSIHKDTTLRVRLPCGSVRLRKVAVFPQCDRVVLRLGKKHLHGAFSTYKNYEVLDVSSNGGDVVVDGMVLFPLVLRTAAGVVQLLLDSQMHCKVWKNAIEGILSDQNWRRRSVRGRRRWRMDWSNLGGEGPAGLIAERVLANDVADYIRFRAVCRLWRLRSVDPLSRALDCRFLPRRWIMLDKAAPPRCRRFLYLSTGECIRTDLPELESHTLVALAPEGLLLLLHQRTLLLRLLNPLTRHLTDLPPVTALLTPEQLRSWHSDGGLEDDPLLARGVGLASATTVALFLCRPKLIAVAKPGDECWAVVVADKNRPYIDSALPFAGRFYCAIGGSVMVLDSSPSSDQIIEGGRGWSPPLSRASPCISPGCQELFTLWTMVGSLMLVYRKIRQSNVDDESRQGAAKYEMKYDVYRVDFDAGDLIPRLAADTLYLGFDCREKTQMNEIDGYNVADGSSEPCHLDSIFREMSQQDGYSVADGSSEPCHLDCIFLQMLQQPYSFVNCLSHCIQGIGDHLA